jgi:hypothetical protein
MINPIEPIYNKIYYFFSNNKKEFKDSTQFESVILKKAKALFYQSGMKNPDQRAFNLIIMAENANEPPRSKLTGYQKNGSQRSSSL